MSKHVLDVGNCGMDHSAIRRLLESHLGATVTQADSAAEALSAARRGDVDLLLVNRRFDRDGDDGLELIRSLKADPDLQHIPVMLLSNYLEYQQEAERAGALAGFGKAALGEPATLDRLRQALQP